MSKPLVVSIPHNLGRAEATRRLQKGLGEARQKFGSVVGFVDETWTGDHLDFKVAAMGQEIRTTIDVFESHVRLELVLPPMLAFFGKQIENVLRKETTDLLEDRSKR